MSIEEENQYIEQLFEDLLGSCPRAASEQDIAQIRKAFEVASDAHKGVRRKGGNNELYITHPLAVAKIVATEIGLGNTSVISALLHDVVEDSEHYTIEHIIKIFGDKVAKIIDGVTKIPNSYDDQLNIQAEAFKKMLMAIPQDIRVVFIKIADRLHNMRTMEGMPEGNQMIKSAETLFVYAPIAKRLGLHNIQKELEDLSFRYRFPLDFNRMLEQVGKNASARKSMLNQMIRYISESLNEVEIQFSISIVTKSLYSIWRQMKDENIRFEDIYNYEIIRVIFEPEEEGSERSQCYNVYAQVTECYAHRSGSVKDNTQAARSNTFEGLVFDIMGPMGAWVEVQVLTERMGEIAERGYPSEKHRKNNNNWAQEREKWIDSITKQMVDPEANAVDILDDFRQHLVAEEIYVFSPKGQVVSLPKGSSILDYAYSIHTELGNHCVGAYIDAKPVSLDYILKNADRVKIIDSSISKPKKEWLDFVITAKAKNSLRLYFKKEKTDSIDLGRIILKKAMDEFGISRDEEFIRKLADAYHCKSATALYARIGKQIINQADLEKTIKQKSSRSWIKIPEFIKPSQTKMIPETGVFNPKKPFVINEAIDFQHIFGNCCRPIPGDKAVVYNNDHGTTIIHKVECPVALELTAKYGKKRIALVKWGKHDTTQYLSKIAIHGINRKKVLHEIAFTISIKFDCDIHSFKLRNDHGIFRGSIEFFVHNVEELELVIESLRSLKDINSVNREEPTRT